MIFNRPYRVIIIDDDESVIDLLKLYLDQFNSDLITYSLFTNAKEALDFIENHIAHIVVTDIHLEDMSGTTVISKIMEMEKGIQVIALSADKTVITGVKCYNKGARFFLNKPIDKNLFVKVIGQSIDVLESWHELISGHLQNTHTK